MALKKGVCKNFSNCTLADKDEIQEVDSSEFICKECGKPLDELSSGSGGSGSGRGGYGPRILTYIIIALILIGGGVGAYFGLYRAEDDHSQPLLAPDLSNPNPHAVALSLNKTILNLDAGSCDSLVATYSTTPSDVDSTVSLSFSSNDTNVVQIDHNGLVKAISKGEATICVIAQMEVGVADTAIVNVSVNEKNEIVTSRPNPVVTSKPKEFDRGWYTWDGDYSNGKEHGKGTMVVKQTYTIDLSDITGSKITVYPGEVIIAMFEHGQLRGGDIIHKDGSSTTFVNNLGRVY